MSWAENHKLSENYVAEAETRERGAKFFWSEAAEAEENAFNDLDKSKEKTLGITAVSAVSLWLKAGQPQNAIRFGNTALKETTLPEFARLEISEILRGLGD